MYYKSSLSVENVYYHEDSFHSMAEALTIEFKNMSLLVTLIYRHPRGNIASFLSLLDDILSAKYMQTNKKDIIFCGDININTLEDTKNVKKYQSLIESSKYEFLINDPTRVSKHNQTCIDHIFVKIKQNSLINTLIRYLRMSDHKSILIELSHCVKSKTCKTILTRYYSAGNIEKFKGSLEEVC